MEHIKQQIEALREQADKLAQVLGGKKAHITVKLINNDDTHTFTEQQAGEIDRIMTEAELFSERSSMDSGRGDGTHSAMYHLKKNHAFYIMFYVKESRETEIDRLQRRLAELEGGERV